MEYCGRLWLARFVLPALIIALVITSQSSAAAMAPHLSAAEQATVRAPIEAVRTRAKAIAEAKGKDIARD